MDEATPQPAPPPSIDGAEVLLWALAPQATVASLLYGYAICRYVDSAAVCRFSCDPEWETLNDFDHATIDDALASVVNGVELRKLGWRLGAGAASRVEAFDRELQDEPQFRLQNEEIGDVDAILAAHSFGTAEWLGIDAIWRARPDSWKRCLLVVLSELAPPKSAAWLFEVIVAPPSDDDAMALAASLTFQELRKERRVPPPPAAVKARIRELWAPRFAFSATQLEEVLADLDAT